MTQTLEALSRRVETLNSVRGIVRTMKTMSAINAAPYEQAAQAIGAYHQTVLAGFQAFLKRTGPPAMPSERTATQVVVAFGSDHGLCGGYNEAMATEVSRHLNALGDDVTDIRVLCVGARMRDALISQGINPIGLLLPPASAEGIGRLAGDLATRLVRETHAEGTAVALAYSERTEMDRQEPVIRHLLPLDPELIASLAHEHWVSRSLPEFTLPAKDLFAELIREHLFASLFRASAEALLTENAARLALMQQAEKSIDERLGDLKSEARTVRQTEITTELIDVISGFEALTKRARKHGNKTPSPGGAERWRLKGV